MKLEVQNVKYVPPEWYDDREKFEKKGLKMFNEMEKFVNEVKGDVEEIKEHSKIFETEMKTQNADVANAIEDLRKEQSQFLTILDTKMDDFIEAHLERHENEKGLLAKIFGR